MKQPFQPGDKKTFVHVVSEADTARFESGDEEQAPDSCCEDKVISYKVTNDQHHADAQKLKLSVPVLDAIVDHGYSCDGGDCLHCARGKQDYLANAPPGLWQSIPLYKLHSSLTYYG